MTGGKSHPVYRVRITGESEILRALITDFDLAGNTVLINERKRDRSRRTTRTVPLSPFLAEVMRGWFEGDHPSGPYAICRGPNDSGRGRHRCGPRPVSVDESNHHFGKTLEGSKWSVVRGWHVLRHSFASN
jgi:integrase